MLSSIIDAFKVPELRKKILFTPVSYTHLRIEKMNAAGEKNVVKTWSRASTIFPDKPITKKPAETRMGSGKGNPEAWVAVCLLYTSRCV